MWSVLTVSLPGKNTLILSSLTGNLLLGVGWGRVLSFAFEDAVLPRKVKCLQWAQWSHMLAEVQDAEEGL